MYRWDSPGFNGRKQGREWSLGNEFILCISSPIFPNELILTENICKFISNLAWDSVGSSSKHHGFIHVEMSACSYVYMHITTNSPFLCPIFPATGRTKQVVMQSLCRTREAVSPFRLSPGSFFAGTNTFAARMWLMALTDKVFLFLSFIPLK